MSVYRALLRNCICWALLSVYKGALRVSSADIASASCAQTRRACGALLSVYRALLSVYRALLSVYRASLSVYRALLSVCKDLLRNRCAQTGRAAFCVSLVCVL